MKVVLCYSYDTSLYKFIYFHFLNFEAAWSNSAIQVSKVYQVTTQESVTLKIVGF